MRTQFDPAAEQELADSIRRYLAEAGPLLAGDLAAEVKRIVGIILARPRIGTPGARGTRSYPLRRYPYSLHYRIEPELIRVLAFAHHRRRPGYWKKRGSRLPST